MLAALRNHKEVTALLAVTVLIVALVGFMTVAGDDDIFIDDTRQVIVPEGVDPLEADQAAILAAQLRREQMGLPTGLNKRLDGRSHSHGGYGSTFRVVDSESGTGVSGAIVFFLPQKQVSEIDWKWRREEVVRTRGQRLRADNWGDVRIQNFIGSAVVLCAHRGQYGELYIKSFYDVMTNKNELVLKPDYAVKVQVLSPKGRGVKGVPVALWRDNLKGHNETNGLAPRRILIWTGTTQGSSGIAYARRSLSAKSSKYAGDDGWNGPLATQLEKGDVHATFYFPPLIPQALFENLNSAMNKGTLSDASGVTRSLMEQVSEVSMTSQGPQCRPLELPATGAIRLTLRQDSGEMYEEPCVVWIGSYSSQREKGPSTNNKTIDFDPKLQSISSGSVPFVAERGVVNLPHVGLFSSFTITVMPMNKSHDAVEMIVHGPTRDRQRKAVDVPLGPERGIASARVETSDGLPFAKEHLDIVLAVPGVAVNGAAKKHHRVKTNEDGVFEIRIPTEFALYEKLELRITGMKKSALQEPPYAARLIKTPDPATVSKVGVFRLSNRGLICRGRIFDENKRPLPGAKIRLLRRPFPEELKRQSGDSRILALTQTAIIEEEMASFTSNKQGYFTHGGYRLGGTWEMIVSHGDGDNESTTQFEFEPGQSNMEVVVEISSAR
ncbi:MAG: hypothetical protein ACI97A_003632 [Planctomycetota bacterium]|jgi:hypothetical protein